MEKHFWIGIRLLAVLLILSLSITAMMYAIHLPIRSALEQACQAALQDQPEQAAAFCRQAKTRWQRFRSLSAAVADHDPIEAADSLFAQLDVYTYTGNWEEFANCCAQLSRQVQAMVQAHIPSWWNLL